MKTFHYLLLAGLLAALPVQALTLDEVAGTYEGKTTAINASGLTRFDQVTVIEPSGRVTLFLHLKGESQPQVVVGFISSINDDGTFPVPGGYGRLTLHGRHLTLILNLPGLATDFQGHRTDSAQAL